MINLLYSPALESLFTSTFIFSRTSDNALLVTPTHGSVSTVTLDQSFISESYKTETMFSMTGNHPHYDAVLCR